MASPVLSADGDLLHLGYSKAIVIDNRDPAHKSRINCLSPYFGETGFIPYLTPDDGFFSLPDVGNVVYLQAAAGDSGYLIATHTMHGGPDSDPDVPILFQRDVPTNRGWVTPGDITSDGKPVSANGGHSIELDDGIASVDNDVVTQTKESKGVRIITSGGHSLKMLEEEDEGSQSNRLEAVTTGGQSLEMVDDNDAAQQHITVKDAEERTIEVIKADDRIRIRNKSGTIFIDIDFANDVIEIDANNVKLGTSAAEAIVRGDTFRALFNSHTHPTPAGPTSPPFQQMDPPSANTHLSDLHKVE